MQQLELSFAAHFNHVTIHPFYDSNGRTSRLLMNFIQQFSSLPLAIVFKEDKPIISGQCNNQEKRRQQRVNTRAI
jgi:Fic family protein